MDLRADMVRDQAHDPLAIGGGHRPAAILQGPWTDGGRTMSAADGERIVRLVAHHVGAEVHADKPRVSAELPETGERFEGLLPPVVAAPAFAIRKPAVAVFTLDDYVAAGIMLAGQAAVLRAAVADRKNILVAGGTSTGRPRSPTPSWLRSPAPPTAWC